MKQIRLKLRVNMLLFLGIFISVVLISCKKTQQENPKVGHISTKLCIYPVPNPSLSGMAAWEDSYSKASELKAKVVTFYYKLKDLDENLSNDECIIKYLAPIADTYKLELAIEIEAPAPPGVIGDIPVDIQGLDFSSQQFQNRYASLVSGFLDAVNTYDTNHRLKYLFFGNEVDSYFNTHVNELANWDSLLSRLIDSTSAKCPQILAGTVVTYQDAFANNHLNWVPEEFGPRCSIIACTFYPEWMPNGYEEGKLDTQFSDIVSAYGGTWKLAMIESGISADHLNGGSESKQITYLYEQLNAISTHSADFEFASYMFSVFPLSWGSPPFSDWVSGVSVYRSDGTSRPIRDVIIENVHTDY